MIRKILIITFALATFSFGIKNVNGALIEDKSVTTNRELSCDKENMTSTKFSQPSAEVYRSDFCTVTCSEDVSLYFNSIKNVYAGGGFAYPLSISAKKTCIVNNNNTPVIGGKSVNINDHVESLIKLFNFLEDYINYGKYNADMNGDGIINYRDLQDLNYYLDTYKSIIPLFQGRRLLDLNNDNVIDANAQGTVGAEIAYIRGERQKCLTYGDAGDTEYKIDADASLEITSENNTKVVEKLSYIASDPDSPKYDRNVTFVYDNYLECTIGEYSDNNKSDLFSCRYDYGIKSWKKVYTIIGRYTMGDKKVTQPQGYVVDYEEDVTGKYCVAKEKYFTNIKMLTKPIPEEVGIDNGYPMTLYFNNFGNNINPLVSPVNPWSLKVNCWYRVTNFLSPQDTDPYYPDYNNTKTKVDFENDYAIVYRPIDLENPFPNERKIGSNWLGNYYTYENGERVDTQVPLIEKHILSEGNNIKKQTLYRIDLTKEAINSVREYNSTNSYTRYDDDFNEKSDFYEKYLGSIIKKIDSR